MRGRILLLLAAVCTASAETVMDQCRVVHPAWRFVNGSEFPGATGSLLAAPQPATGLVMSWDFTGGGNYVAALWHGPAQAGLGSFAFAITASEPVRMAVRMIDHQGRTHQSGSTTMPVGTSVLSQACAGPWEHSWGGNGGTSVGSPVSLLAVVSIQAPTARRGTVTISRLTSTGGR